MGALPQQSDLVAQFCSFGKLGIKALLQDGAHFLQGTIAAGM